MMRRLPPEFVCLGVLRRPFGVRGALWLASDTEEPDAITHYAPLFLLERHRTEPYPISMSMEVAAKRGSRRLAVRIGGVNGRDEAAALRDAWILLRRTDLPACAADEFYFCDLIGLQVMTEKGEAWGKVTHCYGRDAGDAVLCLEGMKGALKEVPFTKQAVLAVDLRAGNLTLARTWIG